jgi:hypothetical protein
MCIEHFNHIYTHFPFAHAPPDDLIMLSEITQTEEVKYCMFSFIRRNE